MLGHRVGTVANQEQKFLLLKNASLEVCKILYMFYNTEVLRSCSSPSVENGEFKNIVMNK